MSAFRRRPLTLEEVDARLTPAPVRFDVVLPPVTAGRGEVVVTSFPESVPLRAEGLSRFVLPIDAPVERDPFHAAPVGLMGLDLRGPGEAVPLHELREAGVRVPLLADRPRLWVMRIPQDDDVTTPDEGSVTAATDGDSPAHTAAGVTAVARPNAFFLPAQSAEDVSNAAPSGAMTPDAMTSPPNGTTPSVANTANAFSIGRSEHGIDLTETAVPTDAAEESKSDPAANVVVPTLSEAVTVVARAAAEPVPLVATWLPSGAPIAGALASELRALERAAMTVIADLPRCGADLADALSLPGDYSWGVAITLIVVAGATAIRLDRSPRSNASPTGVDSLFVRREGPTHAVRIPA